MGDKPSAGTQSTFSNSNTNSTSTSGPHPFIVPQLQNVVGSAWDWMGGNMNAPGYFPNGTVAPQSAGAISANTNLFQRGANQLGYGLNDAAKRFAVGEINAKFEDPTQNPYYQKGLEAMFRPQAEQFANIIAPGLDSKFAGSGRTGGGAHFDTTMRGLQDLERSQSDSATKVASDMFNRERDRVMQRQFQGASLLPSFQAMDYQDAAAMQQAGAGNDAFAQRKLDEANQKYSYDMTGQLDWYNRLAQSLLGMYPGGQTQGQSSTSGMSYGTGGSGGGGFGSIAGPIMSGIGMALPFFGPGLSDRRDKTDIEELGIDPLTGFKTYAYRYKKDPKNTPKIVGPMAQDIEKVRPDLVREIGGHKVVSMAALQPAGGLM